MSKLAGWSLTARLITKHFGALGDTVAGAIASFDPETATAADRDALADQLRDAAQQLAKARADFARERDDVTRVHATIADDMNAAQALAQRMQSCDDAAQRAEFERQTNLLLDDVEANKQRLGTEQHEADEARAFVEQLQQVVEQLSQQLAQFDSRAQSARRQLAQAKAARDLPQLRLQQQQTLDSLKGVSGSSNALDALTRKAQGIAAQTEGNRIVADVGAQPAQRNAELEALRRTALRPQAEDTLERIKRLGGSS